MNFATPWNSSRSRVKMAGSSATWTCCGRRRALTAVGHQQCATFSCGCCCRTRTASAPREQLRSSILRHNSCSAQRYNMKQPTMAKLFLDVLQVPIMTRPVPVCQCTSCCARVLIAIVSLPASQPPPRAACERQHRLHEAEQLRKSGQRSGRACRRFRESRGGSHAAAVRQGAAVDVRGRGRAADAYAAPPTSRL